MARYKATENGLVELTAEEIAWKDAKLAEQPTIDAGKARQERDSKLRATDWRAGSDLTMSDEWKAYRQALRDIPAQAGFPNSITWPTEPS
tara:strand:+ start:5552 stop:5821 length:270 start_codon:yes stop_codon:yes gene_type:complete